VSELEPSRLRPLLQGAFAEQYLYAVETGSTQDMLRDGDHPHGTVALAEHQTAGRGRSGRSWEDAPATNLLFSLLLEPPADARLPQLSLVAGLAVASALEHEAMVPALVKWPNDVLIDGGKVAGILLEATGRRVVCGIGINVNQVADDLPPTPRFPAISLRVAAGRLFDRAAVLVAVLAELEHRYEQWLDVGLAGLADDLERRNALRGRRVIVGGSRNGTADAIATDGRLTVVLDDGEATLVGSGEVEIAGT
jgi:BirA family biotin operon repressor/biotin-[acetyl-CoA-carboxylase] ligase